MVSSYLGRRRNMVQAEKPVPVVPLPVAEAVIQPDAVVVEKAAYNCKKCGAGFPTRREIMTHTYYTHGKGQGKKR